MQAHGAEEAHELAHVGRAGLLELLHLVDVDALELAGEGEGADTLGLDVAGLDVDDLLGLVVGVVPLGVQHDVLDAGAVGELLEARVLVDAGEADAAILHVDEGRGLGVGPVHGVDAHLGDRHRLDLAALGLERHILDDDGPARGVGAFVGRLGAGIARHGHQLVGALLGFGVAADPAAAAAALQDEEQADRDHGRARDAAHDPQRGVRLTADGTDRALRTGQHAGLLPRLGQRGIEGFRLG